jgi:hypothetical protein
VIWRLLAVFILLSGCESVPKGAVAEKIGTDARTPRRYHHLASHPYGDGLLQTGFVVAIEKAPKPSVGQGAWRERITPPAVPAFAPEVVAKFKEVMDGDKAMVVTHILAYAPDRGPAAQPRMMTRFLYNVYPNAGAEVFGSLPGDVSYEERGWRALEGELLTSVRDEMKAAPPGAPYTHLVIGSMGWDNDQVECLRRFNAVLDQTRAAAGRDRGVFNPLFVGITWPSVWGGPSWFDLGTLTRKVLGYANKADDADEIGFTLGNWIVNRLGTEAKTVQPRIRLVVFGHSFGARLTSQALFSRALVRPPPARSPVDLYIALQGAFSVRRFIKGQGDEGSPYADVGTLTAQGLRVILTASSHDEANPLARLISGAHHVGGSAGPATARKLAPDMFDFVGVEPDGTLKTVKEATRVIYVDASPIVNEHSDVLDLEAGNLVWSAIRTFAPATPGR